MNLDDLTPEEILETDGYIYRDCIRADVERATFKCLYRKNTYCEERLACKHCQIQQPNTPRSYFFTNLNGKMYLMSNSPLD